MIALERKRHRMRKVLDVATRDGVEITVPVGVIAEWWRGPDTMRELIRRMVRVEPMDEQLALSAGEALARVAGASVVDAIVMASAARRGDIVYTSDYEDLARLQAEFPAVRVLSV